MALRAILAIVLAVLVIGMGLVALGYQANAVEDAAVTNGTNESAEAYNLTTDVLEGMGETFGPGVVWFGVGVIVLLSLGFLYYHAVPGR